MSNRVAIYVRCSTSMQDLGVQIHELTAYAKARNFEVIGIFEEFAVSGSKNTRPKLDEMMKMARHRKFEVLLIWRLDRLGRSTSHLLSLIEEFESIGISLISLKEGFDLSTYLGKAMATIVSALCSFEREILRERVKAGLENARRNGKLIGRPKSNADFMKIVEMKTNGMSYRQISGALNVSHGIISKALKEKNK